MAKSNIISEIKSKIFPKNAQDWLDKSYPKEKRKEIENLDTKARIRIRKLRDQLDLRDFVNLKKLVCSGNEITSLNIKGLKKLEVLECYNNKITRLDVGENVKLKSLYCQKNPLTEITGLEKLRELTFIKSFPFSFLTNELGKNIDEAKKLLIGGNEDGGYKKLMREQVGAYERVVNSSDVFESEEEKKEIDKYRLEIDDYKEQIGRVEVLTNKWK